MSSQDKDSPDRGGLDEFGRLLAGLAPAGDADDDALTEPAADLLRKVTARVESLTGTRYAVGIELLHHRLVGVLVDERGERLADAQAVLADMDVRAVVAGTAELTAGLLDAVPAVNAARESVMLGFQLGGPVDARTGTVLFYHKAPPDGPWSTKKIRWRERQPLGPMLEQATGLRTVVENDANAYANLQRWFGVGRETSRFAVVLIREGVGGSLVVHDQISDSPLELGNLVVMPDKAVRERPCDCGNRGCLETTGGIHGILENVYRKTGEVPEDLSSAAEMAEHFDTRGAEKAFEEAGHANAMGIGVIVNFHDPERVVVYAPPVMVDPEEKAARAFRTAVAGFRSCCHPAFGADCEVIFQPIGPYDGAVGVALLGLERGFGILPEVALADAEWSR